MAQNTQSSRPSALLQAVEKQIASATTVLSQIQQNPEAFSKDAIIQAATSLREWQNIKNSLLKSNKKAGKKMVDFFSDLADHLPHYKLEIVDIVKDVLNLNDFNKIMQCINNNNLGIIPGLYECILIEAILRRFDMTNDIPQFKQDTENAQIVVGNRAFYPTSEYGKFMSGIINDYGAGMPLEKRIECWTFRIIRTKPPFNQSTSNTNSNNFKPCCRNFNRSNNCKFGTKRKFHHKYFFCDSQHALVNCVKLWNYISNNRNFQQRFTRSPHNPTSSVKNNGNHNQT